MLILGSGKSGMKSCNASRFSFSSRRLHLFEKKGRDALSGSQTMLHVFFFPHEACSILKQPTEQSINKIPPHNTCPVNI